jgi:uncharacterized protein (TIGR04255 family)
MARIPRKLKRDPIVEALFELRFTSSEISEIVVGKLASWEQWKGFTAQRLPLADMPVTVRENDPNLAHQPVLQLQRSDGGRVVKIGPRVFSYHALQPYPGWAVFEPELTSCTEHLFGSLSDVSATRLGFRYLNVLTKDDHLIENLQDLNFDIRLADQALTCPLNLNYQRNWTPKHNSIVRIASKEFVQNPAAGLTALVDVDVFTPEQFKSMDATEAQGWLGEAHKILKEEFFNLLPGAIIDKLDEEK